MANEESCSSCGGQHRVQYIKDPQTGKIRRVEVQQEAVVAIEVEFVGSRVGNFTVSGATTKRQYRFGNFQRVQEVDEADVESVLHHPYGFRLVGGPAVSHQTRRRGDPPNINTPIVAPQQQRTPSISAAEAAARAASAPKGAGAEARTQSGSGRSAQPGPRITPRRDTLNTTKVNPRTLGL